MKKEKQLRALLSSSFILGGCPRSGKSTIADRLIEEFDIPYYKVDDFEVDHLRKANQKNHPTMYGYGKMTWDEIWSQPVKAQVKDEIAYYNEQFDMILKSLLSYKNEKAIIMEGSAFLPSLIHTWSVEPQRAIFLIPTKEFQIRHYSKRPWIKPILDSCQNPHQAFSNWMDRDHLFGQEIIRQAKKYSYPYVIIDGNSSVDSLYKMNKKHFGLG